MTLVGLAGCNTLGVVQVLLLGVAFFSLVAFFLGACYPAMDGKEWEEKRIFLCVTALVCVCAPLLAGVLMDAKELYGC